MIKYCLCQDKVKDVKVIFEISDSKNAILAIEDILISNESGAEQNNEKSLRQIRRIVDEARKRGKF